MKKKNIFSLITVMFGLGALEITYAAEKKKAKHVVDSRQPNIAWKNRQKKILEQLTNLSNKEKVAQARQALNVLLDELIQSWNQQYPKLAVKNCTQPPCNNDKFAPLLQRLIKLSDALDPKKLSTPKGVKRAQELIISVSPEKK